MYAKDFHSSGKCQGTYDNVKPPILGVGLPVAGCFEPVGPQVGRDLLARVAEFQPERALKRCVECPSQAWRGWGCFSQTSSAER